MIHLLRRLAATWRLYWPAKKCTHRKLDDATSRLMNYSQIVHADMILKAYDPALDDVLSKPTYQPPTKGAVMSSDQFDGDPDNVHDAPKPDLMVSLTRARDLKEAMKMIEHVFTYHAAGEKQRVAYIAIRDAAKAMVCIIIATVPPSADRTVALRKVREAVMYANASLALGGKW